MKLLLAAALVAAFSLAHAVELGRAKDEAGQVIVLHDAGGPCPAGLMWVELITRGRKAFDGCAKEAGGVVYIIWSDGDRDRVMRKAFKPAI